MRSCQPDILNFSHGARSVVLTNVVGATCECFQIAVTIELDRVFVVSTIFNLPTFAEKLISPSSSSHFGLKSGNEKLVSATRSLHPKI